MSPAARIRQHRRRHDRAALAVISIDLGLQHGHRIVTPCDVAHALLPATIPGSVDRTAPMRWPNSTKDFTMSKTAHSDPRDLTANQPMNPVTVDEHLRDDRNDDAPRAGLRRTAACRPQTGRRKRRSAGMIGHSPRRPERHRRASSRRSARVGHEPDQSHNAPPITPGPRDLPRAGRLIGFDVGPTMVTLRCRTELHRTR